MAVHRKGTNLGYYIIVYTSPPICEYKYNMICYNFYFFDCNKCAVFVYPGKVQGDYTLTYDAGRISL